MFPFKRIVFPVDFTENCRLAAPFVADMVRHSGAQLTLLHAFEPLLDIYTELRRRAEQNLFDFAADTMISVKPEFAVREGEASSVIRTYVQHQGADLVMLPTHGRSPIRRMLLGSVTAKTLHDISCPIWTAVHFRQPDFALRLPYRRVVCAVGLDEEAEPLVRTAQAVAQSYQAHLTLAHVIETPILQSDDYGPLFKRLNDAAAVQLNAWVHEWHVDAPVRILQGYIPDCLRDAAIEDDCDLLIAGRGHNQGHVSRYWSHLYGIVRESPCPVLSI